MIKLFSKDEIKTAAAKCAKAEQELATVRAAREKALTEADARRAPLAADFEEAGGLAVAEQIAMHDRATESVRAWHDQKCQAAEAKLSEARKQSRLAQQTVAARAIVADAAKRLEGEPARIAALNETAIAAKRVAAAITATLDVDADLELEPMVSAVHELPDGPTRRLLAASIFAPEVPRMSPIARGHVGAMRDARTALAAAIEQIDAAVGRAESIDGAESYARTRAWHRIRATTAEPIVAEAAAQCATWAADAEIRRQRLILRGASQRGERERATDAEEALIARMGELAGRDATRDDLAMLLRHEKGDLARHPAIESLINEATEAATEIEVARLLGTASAPKGAAA